MDIFFFVFEMNRRVSTCKFVAWHATDGWCDVIWPSGRHHHTINILVYSEQVVPPKLAKHDTGERFLLDCFCNIIMALWETLAPSSYSTSSGIIGLSLWYQLPIIVLVSCISDSCEPQIKYYVFASSMTYSSRKFNLFIIGYKALLYGCKISHAHTHTKSNMSWSLVLILTFVLKVFLYFKCHMSQLVTDQWKERVRCTCVYQTSHTKKKHESNSGPNTNVR